MNCKNHPDKQAAKECASCEEVFCEDCVSDYRGKTYCGPCQKAEVALATTHPGSDAADLARMKRSLIGCSVVLLALLLIPMFLLIYPCFRLGDVGRCRTNLKEVYEALVSYAEENDRQFPPENNNLSPLFSSKYRKHLDAKIIHCPGAGGDTNRTGRLSDSAESGSLFPQAMSYLYQGGLSLPRKGERAKPLMWDGNSRNHRGKGINVLYTDGTVEFKTKGLSRFRLHRIDTNR